VNRRTDRLTYALITIFRTRPRGEVASRYDVLTSSSIDGQTSTMNVSTQNTHEFRQTMSAESIVGTVNWHRRVSICVR